MWSSKLLEVCLPTAEVSLEGYCRKERRKNLCRLSPALQFCLVSVDEGEGGRRQRDIPHTLRRGGGNSLILGCYIYCTKSLKNNCQLLYAGGKSKHSLPPHPHPLSTFPSNCRQTKRWSDRKAFHFLPANLLSNLFTSPHKCSPLLPPW